MPDRRYKTRFERIAHDLRVDVQILFEIIIGVKHERTRHGQLGDDDEQPTPERNFVSETEVQNAFHRSSMARIILRTPPETIAPPCEAVQVNSFEHFVHPDYL